MSILNKVKKMLVYCIKILLIPSRLLVILEHGICSIKQKVFKNKYSTSLLILDSCYPLDLSGFRFIEYNTYLDTFKDSLVLSNGKDLGFLKQSLRKLPSIIKSHEILFPTHVSRVKVFNKNDIVYAKLAYMVFLNNAINFLPFLEKMKIPFVFTLYPGGGFAINDNQSDNKLRKIMASKYFRKVITTQKITYNYLLENNFCDNNQIEYIYGGVTCEVSSRNIAEHKIFYGLYKKQLDICFVAQKYSKLGQDKGYDTFIKSAKILVSAYDNIYFHVVGGFSESDIDVSEIKSRIKFYGIQKLDWFNHFYQDKDIIVSANVPFKLGVGKFDGFPLTCVVDAMSNCVAAFCCDELNSNEHYENNYDMVFIKPSEFDVVEHIKYFYQNPEQLKLLAINGCITTGRIYSVDRQMTPRFNVLNSLMSCSSEAKKD